jgi:hypothetical protein
MLQQLIPEQKNLFFQISSFMFEYKSSRSADSGPFGCGRRIIDGLSSSFDMLPRAGPDLSSQFPDLATVRHHLDFGMQSADATAVGKLLVFLGHYAALHGPLADCPWLHDHRVVFYVLFVTSNGELKLDIPTRVTALWALSNLVLGSDLATRGSIVGMSDNFFIAPQDGAEVRQKALDSFPVQPLCDQFSGHAMFVCGELMTFAQQHNLM